MASTESNIKYVAFRKVTSDGSPPYNGDMETRVSKLEGFALETRDRLARIESRLDTFATKADLQEMGSSMIKWMVGTAVGLGVAAITVMTFVLNNAAPKPPAAVVQPAQQPPVIINIPGSASTQKP